MEPPIALILAESFCADAEHEVSELRHQLEWAQFFNRLTDSFLAAPTWRGTISALEGSLSELATLIGADSAAIFLESSEGRQLERMARWADPLLEADFGLAKISRDVDPGMIELALTEVVCTDAVGRTHGSTSALARSMVVSGLLSAPFSTDTHRGTLVMSRFRPGAEWMEGASALAQKAAWLFGRALHMAHADQLLTLTYQQGPIGFSVRTLAGVLVDCNERYLELAGQSRDDVESITLSQRLHPEERAWVLEQHQRVGTGAISAMNLEARVHMPDNTWRWVHVKAVRLDAPGGLEPFVLTSLEDITVQHEQRLAVEHAAAHDPLTGLINRRAFAARVASYASDHGVLPDLMILDIDRFKLVNDLLGHQAGDDMLCEVARRIVAAVRSGDTVARLGGDEFAIVVTDSDPTAAPKLAERLGQAMQAPVCVAGTTTTQTLSIGVAVGRDCETLTELMACADRAMYLAKAAGRNRHVVYDRSTQAAKNT